MAYALPDVEDIRVIDIEELNKKLDAHIRTEYHLPSDEEITRLRPFVDALLIDGEASATQANFRALRKQYHYSYKNSVLYQVFLALQLRESDDGGDEGCGVVYTEEKRRILQGLLKIKHGRDYSGILSVTIFTSPYPEYVDSESGEVQRQSFSCKWNCAYCPNEPGQPRSYLKGEPGVLRANREKFDCVGQMRIRLDALYYTGHEIDKLEVNVLGGTWTSYPEQYREQFIRDMYYAANTYGTTVDTLRGRYSLTDEKLENQTARVRVIGLTLETRPDTITPDEIRRFRYYGCTRLQLGVQHIDDGVLKTIRRDCTTQRTIAAIELLKNCGYKIDAHWMPNLPGSSRAMDDEMLNDRLLGVYGKTYETRTHAHRHGHAHTDRGAGVGREYWEKWDLRCPELQVDQWKVYPCTVVPYTDIERWFLDGSFVQYPQDEMIDLIIKMKSLIFPWIRLNRIIRDIPNDYALRKDYYSNIRQDVVEMLKTDGWYCACIRCREVKNRGTDKDKTVLRIRQYNASGGVEYFISFESVDNHILYGFVRLRLTRQQATNVFPELAGCGMIRELHVYGQLKSVTKTAVEMDHTKNTRTSGSGSRLRGDCNRQSIQHCGFGKRLMVKAEEIAADAGYQKMSVIAGEGTREYYRRLGYCDAEGKGTFMIKSL
jgi:histone acetyltransferase (RNA polymerase elongator complex component)